MPRIRNKNPIDGVLTKAELAKETKNLAVKIGGFIHCLTCGELTVKKRKKQICCSKKGCYQRFYYLKNFAPILISKEDVLKNALQKYRVTERRKKIALKQSGSIQCVECLTPMIKTTTNNVYCGKKCRGNRDNRVTLLGIKGARKALIKRADDRYKGVATLKIKNRKKPMGSICNCAWCNTEYVKQSVRQMYCIRMCGVESGKCKATYLKRNSTNKDKKTK